MSGIDYRYKNKIGFILPVTHVSRKFARRRDKVNYSAQSVPAWIGAATSTMAVKENPAGNNRNWIVVRKAPMRASTSQDLIWAKARFSAVSIAVAARAKDLSKISADQQAFFDQLNTPGCVYTIKAWYWKQEGETYDAAHPHP